MSFTISEMATGYILTVPVEETSPSLIEIAGATNLDRFAKVVAIGGDHFTEFGAIVPVPAHLEPEDVLFHTGAMSTEVMRDGIAYKAIPFSQVIAKVDSL